MPEPRPNLDELPERLEEIRAAQDALARRLETFGPRLSELERQAEELARRGGPVGRLLTWPQRRSLRRQRASLEAMRAHLRDMERRAQGLEGEADRLRAEAEWLRERRSRPPRVRVVRIPAEAVLVLLITWLLVCVVLLLRR